VWKKRRKKEVGNSAKRKRKKDQRGQVSKKKENKEKRKPGKRGDRTKDGPYHWEKEQPSIPGCKLKEKLNKESWSPFKFVGGEKKPQTVPLGTTERKGSSS